MKISLVGAWKKIWGNGGMVADHDVVSYLREREKLINEQIAKDEEPRLGYATTRQLLGEIRARIEMDGQLDYSTVKDTTGKDEGGGG